MVNFDQPHRRFNPLNGQWVLVSPHRARRPWLGQVEKAAVVEIPAYDPTCTLCPGNQRVSGVRNEAYTGTFVFDNDFPALLRAGEIQPGNEQPNPLFRAEQETGICRVVCFSPRHDLTLPQLSVTEVEAVLRTWSDQTAELSALDEIGYVQVFENKGAMMGCSNPHPHSQIWATGHVPNEPAAEAERQEAYLRETGRCLLCDVLRAEQADGRRIVAANEHFTALVPFWAVWPFEMLVVAHRHMGSLPELSAEERLALADVLRQVTIRYDNLFEISFPYSMGFHQTPCDGGSYPGWHFHLHFYPPLLRSATVRKFMVGFEMLGMPQRDLTPETAAERLRGLSGVHYCA
ncbi:MAG: UDP-glucose--hexose-1-phosphate uridylyltransferase [Longilinea sp.]|nr:UDP-glucose--hexose-1-phosphate uridylyltransferase [Longilinea sp.]MCA1953983.1 UDP-glucose--hexose-1-phosphate uridylyltransferase [Anaerolinea sp.]